MTWELRPSIDDKQGTPIDQSAVKKTATSNTIEGEVSIPVSASPQVLSVRVLNNAVKRAWDIVQDFGTKLSCQCLPDGHG
jgi:hypothetical protein